MYMINFSAAYSIPGLHGDSLMWQETALTLGSGQIQYTVHQDVYQNHPLVVLSW